MLHVGVRTRYDKLFDSCNAGHSSTFSRGRAAFRCVSLYIVERPEDLARLILSPTASAQRHLAARRMHRVLEALWQPDIYQAVSETVMWQFQPPPVNGPP